jgi:hypothetical protein
MKHAAILAILSVTTFITVTYHIGGIMIRSLSAVDRGFEPWSGQIRIKCQSGEAYPSVALVSLVEQKLPTRP